MSRHIKERREYRTIQQSCLRGGYTMVEPSENGFIFFA